MEDERSRNSIDSIMDSENRLYRCRNKVDSSMEDENHLYRKEFYVLWTAGIKEEPCDETVTVCSASVDEGSTTIIRTFYSVGVGDYRSDEKFLDWLVNEPYISESSTLELEVISNVSPLYAFSNAFSDLIILFKEQEKQLDVELKIVRLINIENDEDAEENKEGLRMLHKTGVKLSPVSGKDWGYLRQILREKKGNVYQEHNFIKVRKQLSKIIKNPQDVSTSHEIDFSENGTITDVPDINNIGTHTEQKGFTSCLPPNKRGSDDEL